MLLLQYYILCNNIPKVSCLHHQYEVCHIKYTNTCNNMYVHTSIMICYADEVSYYVVISIMIVNYVFSIFTGKK